MKKDKTEAVDEIVHEPVADVTVPKPVPWSPWLGVLYVVATYYVSQLIASLVLLLYPLSQHWSSAHTTSWLNNSIPAQFVYITLAEGLTIGAIYLFLRRYKLKFPAIGFKRPRVRDPLYSLAAVIPYYVLYAISVGAATHIFKGLNVNQQQQIGFTNVHGMAELIMTFISLVILPPLTEEIMVRGFLYSSLKKGMPQAAAVIVTSLIFASAHLPEGGAAGPLYIAAIDTFTLSLVLIYLREKTGSLWAGIGLHALKNGVAFVALFVVHVH